MRNDSAPAAQKALTNIGRTNKEMIGLELRTIPTPIVDAGTFDAMLARFRGNIDKTLHKTVRIPGMPSTSEIRSLYEPGQRQTNRPTANANLISENRLTFQGHPARDIRGTARGNAAYDNRIVVVGNRLYTLLVIDASGRHDTESIERFFNSLQFH